MIELRAGLTTVCDAIELLSLISSQIHLYKLFQNCFSVAARLNHGKKNIWVRLEVGSWLDVVNSGSCLAQ